MGALKTVFRRVGGRIIPIRVSAMKRLQDEFVTISEVQKARSVAREGGMDILGGSFLKTAQKRAKIVGETIAKRISRFKSKGIKY